MARKPATVPASASAAARPRPAQNRRTRAAEQASQAANAALVMMGLLVLGSVLLLAGPAVEAIVSGVPADMPLFDTAIRLASMTAPGKVALAFGYLVVAVLTLLISGEINGKVRTVVFGSCLVSLLGALYGWVHVSHPDFLRMLSNFPYAGNVLGSMMPDPFDQSERAAQALKDYQEKKDAFQASTQLWFVGGGLWNVVVIISMIKNKVDADLFKRLIGLGI